MRPAAVRRRQVCVTLRLPLNWEKQWGWLRFFASASKDFPELCRKVVTSMNSEGFSTDRIMSFRRFLRDDPDDLLRESKVTASSALQVFTPKAPGQPFTFAVKGVDSISGGQPQTGGGSLVSGGQENCLVQCGLFEASSHLTISPGLCLDRVEFELPRDGPVGLRFLFRSRLRIQGGISWSFHGGIPSFCTNSMMLRSAFSFIVSSNRSQAESRILIPNSRPRPVGFPGLLPLR